MEEKPDMQNHRISLTGRQFGMITGVSDVVSFDVTEIVLETEMGMLMIKGKDLHVNRLTLEKGEVDIERYGRQSDVFRRRSTTSRESLSLAGCLNR